jgi:hypothetical protein
MSELCICNLDAAVVYNSKSLIVNKAEIEHACPWSTTLGYYQLQVIFLHTLLRAFKLHIEVPSKVKLQNRQQEWGCLSPPTRFTQWKAQAQDEGYHKP